MSFSSQAKKSLVFGLPVEIKRLKQVKEKYEEIQPVLSNIRQQLNETELRIASLLILDKQSEGDRKKLKRLKQKKSVLEQEFTNLRTQYDAVDQIQRKQQSKKLYYSRVRNDIQNNLEKMKGYQFIVVYWHIKYIMEATAEIVPLENYLENILLPGCANKSMESIQIDVESSENDAKQSQEVFEDAQEFIKIDDNFMNDSLINNLSGGVGSKVLQQLKDKISSMDATSASASTAPVLQPTCGQEIELFANNILEKRAVKKEEQMQITLLTETKDQGSTVTQEKLIIESNEQKLMIQEHEEVKCKMKLELNQQKKEEFEKKLKDQQMENERKLNEKKQKREEYEKETRRLEEEDLKNFETYSETIVKSVLAQIRFEAKEKEWSDWLKTMQNAITKAKNQFSKFENLITFRHEHKDSVIMEELNRVHITTLGAYHMMYKAWHVAKNYSDSYEDKLILKILLVNFGTICDKLYSILESIDSFEISSLDPIKPIRVKYSQINAFDIHTTSKLRLMSKTSRPESYKIVPEPKYYMMD